MRILISVCTNRGLQAKTMNSLMNLEGEFDVICPQEGYTIAENRNYASVKAVNGKYDYLLFIDDDMVFEPDLMLRLVKNDKDICGVTYRPRCDDSNKTTYHETHKDNLKDNKLFKTDAVGTGVMLIKTNVFLKTKRPWFDFRWFPTGQCKEGEDWFFCRQAIKAGFEVWCDPTFKIGHLGENII